MRQFRLSSDSIKHLFSPQSKVSLLSKDCINPDFKLLPEELSLLSPGAAEKRKQEFFLGRAAAVSAMNQLDIPRTAILRGEKGEPLWPDGVVGSISHSADFAVAVVGNSNCFGGLGIDIQRVEPKKEPRLFKKILTAKELYLLDLTKAEGIIEALKLFSIKEAIYKAFDPLVEKQLGFMDIALSKSPDQPSEYLGLWDKDPNKTHLHHLPCPVCRTLIKEDYLFSGVELDARVS